MAQARRKEYTCLVDSFNGFNFETKAKLAAAKLMARELDQDITALEN